MTKPVSKTASKTAPAPPHGGARLPLGNHPGNTGGKKGRSGRKPDWLKTFCDNLLADPTCKRQVREILKDKDHQAFRAMWQAVADRAHGKPKQSLEVEAGKSLSALLADAFKK